MERAEVSTSWRNTLTGAVNKKHNCVTTNSRLAINNTPIVLSWITPVFVLGSFSVVGPKGLVVPM